MTLEYNWICHVCKAPNSAGVETCRACGFSAIASADAVDAAITGREKEVMPSLKKLGQSRCEEIAALPLWKKPFAYMLRGVWMVGALIFAVNLFGLAWDGIAAGIAITVVAELLYQLLNRGVGRKNDSLA